MLRAVFPIGKTALFLYDRMVNTQITLIPFALSSQEQDYRRRLHSHDLRHYRHRR